MIFLPTPFLTVSEPLDRQSFRYSFLLDMIHGFFNFPANLSNNRDKDTENPNVLIFQTLRLRHRRLETTDTGAPSPSSMINRETSAETEYDLDSWLNLTQ